MLITEAQADVRRVYDGGSYGQLVSAVVWLSAAAAATWVTTGTAVAVLFLGGMLIFPLTWLVIRVSGRTASLPAGHPMVGLAMQIAFTVPVGLVVVAAMLDGDGHLFFPASMVIVGVHYLPFVFLYGMRMFAYLSVALVVPGLVLMLWLPAPAPLGGWFTGVVLLAFSALLRAASAQERRGSPT